MENYLEYENLEAIACVLYLPARANPDNSFVAFAKSLQKL